MAIPTTDRDAESPSAAGASAFSAAVRQPSREESSFSREGILHDYRIAYRSRQTSLLGRREVFTGKAKFGIFGDGKEVAQVALARAFRDGDFRSGYYRDQTLMMALGVLTVEQYFAQLYADPDLVREPCSAGRSMGGHFGTPLLGADGRMLPTVDRLNSSADVSPTGSQMPRLLGLAQASKLYRELPELQASGGAFSRHGDEVAFGTIGNASCAEGMFWEAVNAAGVLGVPMLLSIWDDEYGISVPNALQITKGDLSAVLSGFQRSPVVPGVHGGPARSLGYDLYTVKGWDYPGLCETYLNAVQIVRREHVPAIVHVVEMTQPQGHSTSGSHERYKSKERLEWEAEFDPLRQMRRWMTDQGIAAADELDAIEAAELRFVREARSRAWAAYRGPIEEQRGEVLALLDDLAAASRQGDEVRAVRRELERQTVPFRRDLAAAAATALLATAGEGLRAARALAAWRQGVERQGAELYGSQLYSETPRAALRVAPVPPRYAAGAPQVNGFEVLNACFDAALGRLPNLVALGEDLGKIGDVNQGFAGLQAKYGALRVSDTGIREVTILGQAIGMAMRGLRPIAEIQYLDYILYGLQILSDDLATVRWRTKGLQAAPVIVRTRGHRLEGVWHSGSPMAGILNLVRGMYVCVPRNMTQAAGFYNTLLAGDDPGLVVEVLNGYRLKERLPENIGEMRLPLGVPEVLREGHDVTVVTYGACCRIALEAAERLESVGISVEVIDVQTLLPFDLEGRIAESVRRTNRVLFLDEDVPGGASAYMLQQVVERQEAFHWLDAPPKTLSAKEHRPAYGSDGDYFSKPNRESIFEAVYEMMYEARPAEYPLFWRA
jgi:pyruvate/2-oxoglutarate/acetoin dehydrogenase E1 component/TPP-dependent pyruvate/acetoin dehydrogenase alpha subunit